MQTTSAEVAREVIEAVRDGTVARSHTELYTVGRGRLLAALIADLPFIRNGGYKVRMVAGDLGYGKTHLLSLFARQALSEGFSVSHVELHTREAPLERTEVITAAIIRNSRFPGDLSVEEYLRTWARTSALQDKQEIDSWLRDTAQSMEFRAALRGALASGAGSADCIPDIVQWLAGGAFTPTLTRSTGIRTIIRASIAADVLTSFVTFVQRSGSAGLVLLLDEAEAITSLTAASKRHEANQTLRRLLDNSELRAGFEIVFATTNRFLQDPVRGAQSYAALWERIRSVSTTTSFNPRATVLHLQPLSEAELLELGDSLVDLHGCAYGWAPRLTANGLLDIANRVFGDQPGAPRRYIKSVVGVLDLLEADPGLPENDAVLEIRSDAEEA